MVFWQRMRFLLVSIIALLRRLCCFTKRRRVSIQYGTVAAQESPPDVVIVATVEHSRYKNVPERDWNSWDDRPRTIEEHIEQYRERIAAPPPSTAGHEIETDFFKELTPMIQPQLKYHLSTKMQTTEATAAVKEEEAFSRLAATLVPINTHVDLEDWEDEAEDNDPLNAKGWEQLDAQAQAKQIIREKRQQVRNQRRQEAMAQVKTKSNNASLIPPRPLAVRIE